MEAKLLTDKSRLQEIYDLRVTAYEHSPYAGYVNRQNYPRGYFDELDSRDSTCHWIVEDERQIVGAVRVAVIYDLKDMHENLDDLPLPEVRPFAYCGRTAVHPQYRGKQVITYLDHAVKQFLVDNPWLKFALCCLIPERIDAVQRLGFRHIGDITYDWGMENKTMLGAFVRAT